MFKLLTTFNNFSAIEIETILPFRLQKIANFPFTWVWFITLIKTVYSLVLPALVLFSKWSNFLYQGFLKIQLKPSSSLNNFSYMQHIQSLRIAYIVMRKTKPFPSVYQTLKYNFLYLSEFEHIFCVHTIRYGILCFLNAIPNYHQFGAYIYHYMIIMKNILFYVLLLPYIF